MLKLISFERIPYNWAVKELYSICYQIGDIDHKMPKSVENGIPFISAKDLTEDGKLIFSNCKQITHNDFQHLSKKIKPEKGDIIYSRIGTIGRASIVDVTFPFQVSYSCCIIKPIHELVDNKYLRFFMSSQLTLRQAFEGTIGVGVPDLGMKQIKEFKVLLPPLPEQRAIVVKIEQLFSELDNGIASLKKAQEQLKVYRQAVLKWAFEGKLTEKWREENRDNLGSIEQVLQNIKESRRQYNDPEKPKIRNDQRKGDYSSYTFAEETNLPNIPSHWMWISSGELFSKVTSGSRGWAEYYAQSGALFIRITNLNFDTLDLDLSRDKIQYVNPPSGSEGTRTKIQEGDFLFSITGYLGMFAICPLIKEAYVNQHIALARPVQGFNKKYIGYWIIAKTGGLHYLNQKAKGAVKAGLGLDDIKSFPIPICPLNEQDKIVEEIETRLSVISKLENEISENLQKGEALRQSILKKAFEGLLLSYQELEAVQQDPEWEPAERLLKNIKVQKKQTIDNTKPQSFEERLVRMEDELKDLLILLKESPKILSAKELWQRSIYKDDIEGFYLELKRLESQNLIFEEKKETESYIGLRHEN